MNAERLRSLSATYRSGLLEDVLPFWTRHAIDLEHGGFMFCLDRDGSVVDTDKGMWQQGRFTWLLSSLFAEVEPREEWRVLAKHGIDFIRRHGFDSDGRMFFHVTRDGRPIRKRRYVFTESFAAIAMAGWWRISGEERAREQAVELFRTFVRHQQEPDLTAPKFEPTRPGKGLAGPMITIVTAQELRRCIEDQELHDELNRHIDTAIATIRDDHMHPELEAVLETVGPNGEFYDHFDGRIMNPGHSIEAAWFILDEARHRGQDAELTSLGTRILDWMWPRGWDTEHGGILYFVDAKGLPVQEYWHDMKFWWPQNEATIATLMAYEATGDARYAEWHQLIHDWMHEHFPDAEHGEWYGYLHRDARVSSPLKGNLWKGPFHIPRMQLRCWQTCERMLADA